MLGRASAAVGAVDADHEIARSNLGGIVETIEKGIVDVGFDGLRKNGIGDELVARAQCVCGAYENFVAGGDHQPESRAVEAAAAVGDCDLGGGILPAVESACRRIVAEVAGVVTDHLAASNQSCLRCLEKE